MINDHKFYTLTEVEELGRQGYFPVKDRHTLIKLIKSNKIKAVNMGAGKKPIWQVKGEDLKMAIKSAGSFEEKGKPDVTRKKTKDPKKENEKGLQEAQREVQG